MGPAWGPQAHSPGFSGRLLGRGRHPMTPYPHSLCTAHYSGTHCALTLTSSRPFSPLPTPSPSSSSLTSVTPSPSSLTHPFASSLSHFPTHPPVHWRLQDHAPAHQVTHCHADPAPTPLWTRADPAGSPSCFHLSAPPLPKLRAPLSPSDGCTSLFKPDNDGREKCRPCSRLLNSYRPRGIRS